MAPDGRRACGSAEGSGVERAGRGCGMWPGRAGQYIEAGVAEDTPRNGAGGGGVGRRRLGCPAPPREAGPRTGARCARLHRAPAPCAHALYAGHPFVPGNRGLSRPPCCLLSPCHFSTLDYPRWNDGQPTWRSGPCSPSPLDAGLGGPPELIYGWEAGAGPFNSCVLCKVSAIECLLESLLHFPPTRGSYLNLHRWLLEPPESRSEQSNVTVFVDERWERVRSTWKDAFLDALEMSVYNGGWRGSRRGDLRSFRQETN
ncbi:uncharacterized protein LOC121140734 [Mesocricetus auratus]|uniref:Uncharacterized protein LOC121140734 n=1 Tax=Mesocricetus auratus TaxID=10036 RepID=A0ABM2XIG4_MESAU|nr:uncharacterized protein LOC121140734 [Mesocricetus auratus]